CLTWQIAYRLFVSAQFHGKTKRILNTQLRRARLVRLYVAPAPVKVVRKIGRRFAPSFLLAAPP
ncbi:MAG: hypothetical protein ACREFE_04165, partial [Limisphaerales bacterium]